jgi:hypothetical protein
VITRLRPVHKGDAALMESKTHSFIVKVWLEETADEPRRVTWRGHITHVPGGERRYLKDLDEIAFFTVPYLREMGVRLGVLWRIRQWLNRLKLCLKGTPS